MKRFQNNVLADARKIACTYLIVFVLFLANAVHGKTSDQSPSLNKVDASAVNYFYIGLPYRHHQCDSGRKISYFIHLLNYKNHRVWWDTGLILNGSTFGYRYVLQKPCLSQDWFLGAYMAYDSYGVDLSKDMQNSLYQLNIGGELGGSQFGQLTISFYEVLGSSTSDLNYWVEEGAFDWIRRGLENRHALKKIDNRGLSIKWVTVPHTSGIQASLVYAHSSIYRKTCHDWCKESINRFGIGFQYSLSNAIHLDIQYIFCDSYQKGWHIGCRIDKLYYQKSHDRFRGRLNRPVERHVPRYKTYEGASSKTRFDSSKRTTSAHIDPPEAKRSASTSSSHKKPYRQSSFPYHHYDDVLPESSKTRFDSSKRTTSAHIDPPEAKRSASTSSSHKKPYRQSSFPYYHYDDVLPESSKTHFDSSKRTTSAYIDPSQAERSARASFTQHPNRFNKEYDTVRNAYCDYILYGSSRSSSSPNHMNYQNNSYYSYYKTSNTYFGFSSNQNPNSGFYFEPQYIYANYYKRSKQSFPTEPLPRSDYISQKGTAADSTTAEFAKLTGQDIGAVQNCSTAELASLYRKASLKYHPDKRAGKSDDMIQDSQNKFLTLSECYQKLLQKRNNTS